MGRGARLRALTRDDVTDHVTATALSANGGPSETPTPETRILPPAVAREAQRVQADIDRLQASLLSYLNGAIAGMGIDADAAVLQVDVATGTVTITPRGD